MSKYIYKSHNVSVLMCYLVFAAKYRREVFDNRVDRELSDACLDIEKRYELAFLEGGTDEEYVNF